MAWELHRPLLRAIQPPAPPEAPAAPEEGEIGGDAEMVEVPAQPPAAPQAVAPGDEWERIEQQVRDLCGSLGTALCREAMRLRSACCGAAGDGRGRRLPSVSFPGPGEACGNGGSARLPGFLTHTRAPPPCCCCRRARCCPRAGSRACLSRCTPPSGPCPSTTWRCPPRGERAAAHHATRRPPPSRRCTHLERGACPPAGRHHTQPPAGAVRVRGIALAPSSRVLTLLRALDGIRSYESAMNALRTSIRVAQDDIDEAKRAMSVS